MRKFFSLLSRNLLVLFVLLFTAASSGFSQSAFSLVKMELALAREGAEWRADAKFNAGGQEFSSPVRDPAVDESKISFSAELAGAEMRFVGKLSGNELAGTLEALEKGQESPLVHGN